MKVDDFSRLLLESNSEKRELILIHKSLNHSDLMSTCDIVRIIGPMAYMDGNNENLSAVCLQRMNSQVGIQNTCSFKKPANTSLTPSVEEQGASHRWGWLAQLTGA